MSLITRQQIIAAIREALEPLDFVYAMWEGGAASFHRVDEWSDIDLQVDAEDERSEEVFPIVEAALEKLAPMEVKYELPKPTWHGHSQTFYRLQNSSEFLMIDFVVIKHSNPNKFLQNEIHGEAIVHFDKKNVVQSPAFDVGAHLQQIEKRLASIRATYKLFQTLTEKEAHRGNAIEAVSYYQNFTLRPLVEVLRIQYQPQRYNFHTRYVYYEFPQEIVKRLEPLFYPKDLADLSKKREQAEQFFFETLNQVNLEAIRSKLMTQ